MLVVPTEHRAKVGEHVTGAVVSPSAVPDRVPAASRIARRDPVVVMLSAGFLPSGGQLSHEGR
jgi:hypothetical protein